MLESAQRIGAAPHAGGSVIAHTARLVRWEIFLARRRLMSKVLGIIFLGSFGLVFGFILLSYVVSKGNGTPDFALQSIRDTLTFPGVLLVGGILTARLAPILVAILAGALVGGEYGYSTQRLAFARGVGRGQMLTAQTAALAIISLGTSVASLALSMLAGVTLGPLIGGTVTGPGAGGWSEITTYTLVLGLILFAYSMMALFFSTLGRSVVAGVGLTIGWLFIEGVISGILSLFAFAPGAFFQFIGHLPDWFLGVATSGLKVATSDAPIQFDALDKVGASPNGQSQAAALGGGHSLLVIAVYLVVFVGVSYWLLRTRDVTD